MRVVRNRDTLRRPKTHRPRTKVRGNSREGKRSHQKTKEKLHELLDASQLELGRAHPGGGAPVWELIASGLGIQRRPIDKREEEEELD